MPCNSHRWVHTHTHKQNVTRCNLQRTALLYEFCCYCPYQHGPFAHTEYHLHPACHTRYRSTAVENSTAVKDTFHDRGFTNPLTVSAEQSSLKPKIIGNVNHASKNDVDVYIYLGHGIVHGDAFCFSPNVSFRVTCY